MRNGDRSTALKEFFKSVKNPACASQLKLALFVNISDSAAIYDDIYGVLLGAVIALILRIAIESKVK